ncbi:MAG: phage tail sheath C-terminal domain-containing protein [Sneathiella sp.]
MPVAVSYPGVYIQEVQGGARAIASVPTSVAAFVGYTGRGPTNTPIRMFSYADFERAFGGLAAGSPLSYAVNHFFLNGGSTAWVVRVAAGDAPATVGMLTAPGGAVTLTATARSSGEWGNNLRLRVDYNTSNPASTFNLTVNELVEQAGRIVVARSEAHRNLSMNSQSANYALDAVLDASDLITLQSLAAPIGGSGTSESDILSLTDLNLLDDDHRRLAISVDGSSFFEFDLFGLGGAPVDASLNDRLDAVAALITNNVLALDASFAGFACVRGPNDDTLLATAGSTGEESSVRFAQASVRRATNILKLGTGNGGREVDAAAVARPAQTGTAGGRITTFPTLPDPTSMTITLADAATNAIAAQTVTFHDTAAIPPVFAPTTLEEARTQIENALRGSSRAEFSRADVAITDNALVITSGGDGFSNRLICSGSGADLLFLVDPAAIGGDPAAILNISTYRMGSSLSSQAMTSGTLGDDGTAPTLIDIQGSRAQKTGLYALEDADIFNILNIPGISDVGVLSNAITYAEERRSMIIVDTPSNIQTFSDARGWINDPANSSLRHKNAVTFWPRVAIADPLKNNRLTTFSNSGVMAGLFSRMDAARGVWKAPAGIEARLRGVQALEYELTDPENGVLNPLGLNCLRTFPVIGSVSWGARTMVGADTLASEWKYVPVRRLALNIEESLYRGTQFVVFEPNDEPLWSQIRLTVGSFMHNLFRQGAFQGSTPRDAYLVKCDATTTTQADIDLGIVNILVGFAPVKPAEFVIIQIQQMAGQSQA